VNFTPYAILLYSGHPIFNDHTEKRLIILPALWSLVLYVASLMAASVILVAVLGSGPDYIA